MSNDQIDAQTLEGPCVVQSLRVSSIFDSDQKRYTDNFWT